MPASFPRHWLELKCGTGKFPAGDGLEDAGGTSVGDDSIRTDTCGNLGSKELGGHAADIARTCHTGCLLADVFIYFGDFGHHASGTVRVAHETIHGGKDHKTLGVDERGDVGGQAIVVADLYLVAGDGVIFIDNGQDVFLREKMLEGLCGVVATGSAVEIGVREKKLGAVEPQLAQVTLIFLISSIWPTVAQACKLVVVCGRWTRPRAVIPAEIAPEETRITSYSSAISPAIWATSRPICLRSTTPSLRERRPEPSLIIQRLFSASGRDAFLAFKGSGVRFRLFLGDLLALRIGGDGIHSL